MRRLLTATALIVMIGAVAPPAGAQVSAAYTDAVGNRWASVYDIAGLNWNEIAAVCPRDGYTACTGVLDGSDVSGWIWATQEQVRALFKEVTGLGPELDQPQYREINSAWAPAALARLNVSGIAQGWVSAPDSDPLAHMALIADNVNPASFDFVTIPFVAPKTFRAFWGTWLFTPSVSSVLAVINQIVLDGQVDQYVAAPLMQLLNLAQSSIDAGNTAAARGQLLGFIREVEGRLRSGALSEANGRALIGLASALRAQID